MRDDYRVDLQDPGERGSVCPILDPLEPFTGERAVRTAANLIDGRQSLNLPDWIREDGTGWCRVQELLLDSVDVLVAGMRQKPSPLKDTRDGVAKARANGAWMWFS
jgi:hypothetical protein